LLVGSSGYIMCYVRMMIMKNSCELKAALSQMMGLFESGETIQVYRV
jgi:hypothetical protein